MVVRRISAVTLAVRDMTRSVEFYQSTVGLDLLYGGPCSSFTSFSIGDGYLNLMLDADLQQSWWGRLIIYVDDVDEMYRRLIQLGEQPSTTPADAHWGERYFHVDDPDGHGLSFAKPL